MKRVLIINPFGVGDVLFSTPVIHNLKNSFPESFIGYWCNERVAELLTHHPEINEVYALSRGDIKKIFKKSFIKGIRAYWNLLCSIRRNRFEIALDFSLDHRYSLFAFLCGVPVRIGFNYKSRGFFLTHPINLTGYHSKSAVEYYLDTLSALKIKNSFRKLEIFVPEDAHKRVHTLLVSQGVKDDDLLIGIAPGAGASWGKDASLKHWPEDKFAQLAAALIRDYKAKIVLLGDASERGLADTIKSKVKEPLVDLVGKTSLSELAAVLSRVRVLVSNDGGPLHMAVALDKPTVSVFGPVDEKVYGPAVDAKHKVITNQIACRPCYKNFRMPVCEHNKMCLNGIEVERVFDALRSLLV